MKVRIGISLGPGGTPSGFGDAVDQLEQAGVDSLWLPENVYGSLVDPFTGMAFALSRTIHLKAGSGISVLPGRHPVLVAKQLASLAGLAPGRVLPVFGLRPAQQEERALFPVPAGRRAEVFDEALTLLRMLLTSENVSFEGEFFTVSGARTGPLPAKPLDIWLGGSAPAGLRRAGRLADGWLGALLTPAEAAAAVGIITEAAAEAGRTVDDDHFGLSVAVTFDGIPPSLVASVRRRRPDADPATLVAHGWDGARRLLSQYVDAGLSKFVIRPVSADGIGEFVEGFVRELTPLQSGLQRRSPDPRLGQLQGLADTEHGCVVVGVADDLDAGRQAFRVAARHGEDRTAVADVERDRHRGGLRRPQHLALLGSQLVVRGGQAGPRGGGTDQRVKRLHRLGQLALHPGLGAQPVEEGEMLLRPRHLVSERHGVRHQLRAVIPGDLADDGTEDLGEVDRRCAADLLVGPRQLDLLDRRSRVGQDPRRRPGIGRDILANRVVT